MTDADTLQDIADSVEQVDVCVARLTDSRQRLLVEWQVKQLRLALKSYARRAEKGSNEPHA